VTMADHDTTTTAALLADLRDELEVADLDYAAPPAPIGGGFWAEIFAIRLSGAPPELSGDLVARIMPDAAQGRRETIVQREVARQGFAAPAVRAAGDGAHLGCTYMVMDRAAGVPLLAGLRGAGAVRSLPRLVRRLPRLLASTALELHLLDPGPVVDALRRDVPGTSLGTDDLVAHYGERADELDNDLLRDATRWLAANRRDPERVSVCHGDLHPFNLLVDDDDDRATLIDWTASRIGDPAYDLAFSALMIRHAPIDVPNWARPAIRKAASWLANDIIRTYRELARPHGITLDDDALRWHTALQMVRVLIEVETMGQDRPGHPFLGMAADVRAEVAAIVRP
jgi:aminoglycoside phosphotransferase (APT) family kinase protein